MKLIQAKPSLEDASVNFVFSNGYEARYVRREPEKLLVYLSAQAGCEKACRFCHLTQTGQTDSTNAKVFELTDQAQHVLDYYQDVCLYTNIPHAQKVHFNFMARGEPLANTLMRVMPDTVIQHIHRLVKSLGVQAQTNISTIMPFEVYDSEFVSSYGRIKERVEFFYSLYSVNPAFRKRWLPKAMKPEDALERFRKWQDRTGQMLTFHWAFIKDQNDSVEDIEKFLELIHPYGFKAKFNCVRYNPYSSDQGEESSEEVIQRNFKMIADVLGNGSRIVPRVGFDVQASCGMFVPGINPRNSK